MTKISRATLCALIDTTQIKIVRVGLRIQSEEIWTQEEVDIKKPQQVLPMLLGLLSTHNRSLQDLSAIYVHAGPGSYTGLRVGFAVANSLGYLLGISVNDRPIKQAALPTYDSE